MSNPNMLNKSTTCLPNAKMMRQPRRKCVINDAKFTELLMTNKHEKLFNFTSNS